jgi:hypothetical protein
MICAESELARRTKHSLGDRAANLPLFQFQSAGQSGADRRERIERPDGDVGCATDNVHEFRSTGVYLRDPEMIRIRMRNCFDDAADDDLAQVGAQANKLVHGRRA